MKLTALTTMTLAAAVAGPVAAQETRELGAHEHGHGALNIAVEGDAVAMELEVPGFDLVGFEHAADSAEDRAAVEDAVAQLARPADLFLLPEGAGCRVSEASVELHGAGHHHEAHHDEAHAEHEDHADDEHAEHEAEHSEFHATYRFACSDAGALTAIELPYFEIFPNAEELEVQIVTDKGATTMEAGRDAPVLDLSGMM